MVYNIYENAFLFRKKRERKNSKKQNKEKKIIIRDWDIKERIKMVMNVPNVEIYLSNKYQTDNNCSFSEAKVFQ